jgi:membrane-bound lytic murein transglycosylase D
MLGLTGLGSAMALRVPKPTRKYDDPVREAVAKTMIERLAGRGWDLPNLDHERVDFWVERFTQDPDMRARLEGFLIRSGRYLPMISTALEDRDMPHDLIFLAMIESGFDPAAYSSANASGLWQFISETGKRYGLRVDSEVDERNHPERATEAALDYLGELHERFGSWYLAAAAYNTGEGRVGRIMREVTGSERATSEEDYYKIWDRLPKETRDYVPLMIAAARIAKEPARYGFDHLIPDEPFDAEEVTVKAGTTLAEVAQESSADVQMLRQLNPHLKKGRTPTDGTYAVKIPRDARGRLAADAAILAQ